jgi:hypothetical protein
MTSFGVCCVTGRDKHLRGCNLLDWSHRHQQGKGRSHTWRFPGAKIATLNAICWSSYPLLTPGVANYFRLHRRRKAHLPVGCSLLTASASNRGYSAQLCDVNIQHSK